MVKRGGIRVASLALLLTSCTGGDDLRDRDAGADDSDAGDAGVGIDPPTPPEPPALPIMTPCPTGWREVQDPDLPELVTCDPWPEGGPEDCALDEAHFPGGPGCERIGTPCPEGDWAEDIPAGASVVYVKAGAPGGGTGSRERPASTIERALALADDGDVIALSKGAYDETVRLTKNVTLWGACVAETILSSSEGDPAMPTVVIGYTSTAAVRNLSITGPHIGVALAFGEAEIESVAISGASYVALAVQEEARLGAREMVVRDTQRLDEGGGYGIQVLLGSVLEIERGEIVRSGYEGIRVGEGSEVHAMRLSVRDSGTAQEHVGAGVDASDGALVELSEAAIEGSAQMGIRAGAGTNISCHDGMIRGNQGLAEGHGAVTLDGALAAVDGARAEFTRVVVEGNTGLVGFSVKQGASLSATDLVVRDSRGAEGGGGVEVLGHADFERAVLARVRHIALGAWSTDSTVYADDLTITRTLADSSGLVGYGLQVSNGASLIVHRADVSANRVVGVLVADRGHLSGSDIRIVDTLPLERDGTHGAGIAIYGSDVELSRVEIERNHQLGIEVWAPSDGERGTVALEDLVVDVTLEQACSEGACAASPGGIAITVRNGALELNRFRLSNAALCGLQVLPDADVDLHQGVVSNNPIGVNMQSEGYDLARLQDGVLYRDNERNFDSQNLPIPEPLDPLEPPDP